jgi:hypothetical protein
MRIRCGYIGLRSVAALTPQRRRGFPTQALMTP